MIRHSAIAAVLLALALPAGAAEQLPGSSGPPPAKPVAPKQTGQGLDAHIKELRGKLRITAAQQPQWDDFVQVMRDNATKFELVSKTRVERHKTMNAVDDLKSFQEIAQLQADGLKRLSDAFQALYDRMSPEQQKNADAVFRDYASRWMRKHA
jgi:hypothetical protein